MSSLSLIALLGRQIAFSRATFGPGPREEGILKHIVKEGREVREAATPHEKQGEWVDLCLLSLDGLWRALVAQGHSHTAAASQAVLMLQQKLDVNESRDWPDWRTQPADAAIEHVRTGEPAGEPTLKTGGVHVRSAAEFNFVALDPVVKMRTGEDNAVSADQVHVRNDGATIQALHARIAALEEINTLHKNRILELESNLQSEVTGADDLRRAIAALVSEPAFLPQYVVPPIFLARLAFLGVLAGVFVPGSTIDKGARRVMARWSPKDGAARDNATELIERLFDND